MAISMGLASCHFSGAKNYLVVGTFGQIYSPLRQIVFGEGVPVCDAPSYEIEPSYVLKINLPNAFQWVVHVRYVM